MLNALFQRIFRFQPSASALPSVPYAGRQEIRLTFSRVPTPSHFYIGLTSDVPARLADHNAGRCPHTARCRPWQLHVTSELPDEQRAVDLERYLKSGSGRAFAKRHFG